MLCRTEHVVARGLSVCRAASIGAAALSIAGLAACLSCVSPLPSNATLMTPPAVYQRWWAMTEACSGRTGDLNAVQWYEVPGSAVLRNGQWAGGYWSPARKAIVIPHDNARIGFTVRHEML